MRKLHRATLLWWVGLCLIAALTACSSNPGSITLEVALPNLVVHPVYRVRAQLPDGWIAEQGHAPIYPADTWTLHPAGQRTPVVTLLLAWTPRGGRHSALFPGGRADDTHVETRQIGGADRQVTVERDGRSALADFDVGSVAVSINGYSMDDAGKAAVDAIIAHLAFDATAAPKP